MWQVSPRGVVQLYHVKTAVVLDVGPPFLRGPGQEKKKDKVSDHKVGIWGKRVAYLVYSPVSKLCTPPSRTAATVLPVQPIPPLGASVQGARSHYRQRWIWLSELSRQQ